MGGLALPATPGPARRRCSRRRPVRGLIREPRDRRRRLPARRGGRRRPLSGDSGRARLPRPVCGHASGPGWTVRRRRSPRECAFPPRGVTGLVTAAPARRPTGPPARREHHGRGSRTSRSTSPATLPIALADEALRYPGVRSRAPVQHRRASCWRTGSAHAIPCTSPSRGRADPASRALLDNLRSPPDTSGRGPRGGPAAARGREPAPRPSRRVFRTAGGAPRARGHGRGLAPAPAPSRRRPRRSPGGMPPFGVPVALYEEIRPFPEPAHRTLLTGGTHGNENR